MFIGRQEELNTLNALYRREGWSVGRDDGCVALVRQNCCANSAKANRTSSIPHERSPMQSSLLHSAVRFLPQVWRRHTCSISLCHSVTLSDNPGTLSGSVLGLGWPHTCPASSSSPSPHPCVSCPLLHP